MFHKNMMSSHSNIQIINGTLNKLYKGVADKQLSTFMGQIDRQIQREMYIGMVKRIEYRRLSKCQESGTPNKEKYQRMKIKNEKKNIGIQSSRLIEVKNRKWLPQIQIIPQFDQYQLGIGDITYQNHRCGKPANYKWLNENYDLEIIDLHFVNVDYLLKVIQLSSCKILIIIYFNDLAVFIEQL